MLLALTAGAVVAFAAATGGGAAAMQAAPINVTAPSIAGITPRVGEVLTARNGTWSGSPTSFRYQWRRCDPDGFGCLSIAGATLKRYTLVAADADHTIRVRVTAVNADGATPARSAPTDVVRPAAVTLSNTGRPSVTGTARVGEELSATEGTWTGNPASFAFQWQRCDLDAASCIDVVGATGRTYGVRAADLGFRLRVAVTAKSGTASTTATSSATSVVQPVHQVANRRPTMRILGIRFTGARVYARFRVCDDSFRNLRIVETDSRPHVRSSTRFFRTRVAPRPCGPYTRNWVPAPRFRHGRFTITLRARDVTGLTSAPARRTFHRGV